MAGFMITVALENVESRKMTVILFCWKFLFGGLRRFLAHGYCLKTMHCVFKSKFRSLFHALADPNYAVSGWNKVNFVMAELI